jgi:hypothetical protein
MPKRQAMPQQATRLMGGPPIKTKKAENLCRQLMPGLGLGMGMERRSSTPTPPVIQEAFQILITGQSLSVGANGLPVLSVSQPGNNVMFNGGVRAEAGEMTSLVPLIATVDADPEGGFDGETLANGMADELAGATARYLVACHGHSSYTYSELKKGTAAYAQGMLQAEQGVALLTENYGGVFSVVTAHGEQDQAFDTPDYAEKMAEWQADYQTDLHAITGLDNPIPLLVYQQCSSSPSQAASADTSTALENLKAHENYPGVVVLVGPNYPWIRSDGIHLTANGYRSMGVAYAKALGTIRAGGTWNPVRPVLITIAGAVIDVTFLVPRPPLALDLERVFNPGDYGFSYTDDDSPPAIQSVAIVGANVVRITLEDTPTGGNKLLRYGWSGTTWSGGAGPAGPLGSARGNLRDAGYDEDNLYGYDSFNWCVLFNKPVPYAP